MDIAQAYVQILPSTDGIGSSLTAALTSAGDSAAGAAGQSAGSKFSAVLGTAAKVGTAAIGAATTAVMAFGKSSVDQVFAFLQLLILKLYTAPTPSRESGRPI